jgi:NADH-quinone oxidoreductase subunit D
VDNSNKEPLKSELLTVNMGPQHPATHGVLRIEIKTDSEIVAEAIPHIGYLHRCMEKHCESLDYRGIIPFVDRMDYLAAMNMELAIRLAVEKMLGNRCSSQSAIHSSYCCGVAANCFPSRWPLELTHIDLGAFTPFLYAFEEREKILRLFEELSGARLLYNYIWIGGVWNDINQDQQLAAHQ